MLVYQQQGKYQKALEMHMKSLEIKIRVCGGDSHTSVADSYNNIGATYQRQGK
jgi:hypothetical protein